MYNSVGKIFEEAAEHRGRVLESRVDRGLSRHQVRKDVPIHEREEVFEVFFFCCIAELAIKPCRSSRSKLRGEFGIPNTCKTGNKNTTKQQTPPNPKHNTKQKAASVWNVKREVRRG